MTTEQLEDLLRRTDLADGDKKLVQSELSWRYSQEFTGQVRSAGPATPAPETGTIVAPGPSPRDEPLAGPLPEPWAAQAWQAPVGPARQTPRRRIWLVSIILVLGAGAVTAVVAVRAHLGAPVRSQPCIVGTWSVRGFTDQDGSEYRVTGGTDTYTFEAAGKGASRSNATLTGPGGYVYRMSGVALFTYSVKNSTITTRAYSVSGGTDVYLNGVWQKRLPYWVDDDGLPISCSTSSLEYGQEHLVRH